MLDPYNKLARILRTDPNVLLDLGRKMNELTGQDGVIESIVQENEIIVERTLVGLGMTRVDMAKQIQTALIHRLMHIDQHLYDLLGKPDLSKAKNTCTIMCDILFKVFTPPKGLFIKRERAVELLEKYPPQNLLDHFGYANVRGMIDKEGFGSIMAALRFTQTQEWMHQYFDVAYCGLKADDFEERDIEVVILDSKWLAVAEKFLQKKYHNVSHLKEHGILFIIPLPIDTPGETLRMFTLMLHYLHEVPFYTSLFRRYMSDPDFCGKFQSLLRGDVTADALPNHGKIAWRVVQRYLAKDNESDARLFEPHVNPEADHWFRAEEDLGRLTRILGKENGRLDVGWWTGLDFVGDFFKDETGREILVSFDLIDLIMSLVQKNRIKYLYHQQEALWNKIFSEYMGRERMLELIDENIFRGYIQL